VQRVIVAPDSFKESLKASQVARQISAGVKTLYPAAEIIQVPLSDGGEGITEALIEAAGGRLIEAKVTGPLGEKIKAQYGILENGRIAVIEMAAASGLPLLPRKKRNPMLTTTQGTGELIKAALEAGHRMLSRAPSKSTPIPRLQRPDQACCQASISSSKAP
jgi:glycerate kinase